MKLAVVMDPIEKIVPEKDGTLDLLLAAQDRNYELTYFQQEDLKIIDGRPLAKGKILSVKDNTDRWFEFSNQNETADRVLASMASIITYWYRYSHEGVKVETATDHPTIGGQFLSLLTGNEPSENIPEL